MKHIAINPTPHIRASAAWIDRKNDEFLLRNLLLFAVVRATTDGGSLLVLLVNIPPPLKLMVGGNISINRGGPFGFLLCAV